jgi:hypothetical protein
VLLTKTTKCNRKFKKLRKRKQNIKNTTAGSQWNEMYANRVKKNKTRNCIGTNGTLGAFRKHNIQNEL